MDDFRRLLRQKLAPFLRNGREGYEVSIRDLVRKRRVYRESKEKGNKKKQRYVKKNSVFPEVVIETGHVPESQTRRVWWDTDKRGAVGETALHLCLLNNSSLYKDLAREMIAECPGLVNDIYLGDLYYGESPLHLAIVNGDYEMVKILLENGAWVDEMAIGSFFYPLDQQNGREDDQYSEHVRLQEEETNYEGPCYFGEYPLMFAACHNQFNIVRLLMQYSNQRQHHDKKSMQHWLDANGNNVLHMMVISGLKHMYRFMLLECHCNDQHHNNRGFTPLSLAAYLGKSDMFHFILKLKCIPLWSYGKTCCALYPLQEIDTVSCRKEEKQMSVISHVVTRNTVIHSEMIDGLIYAILQAKWKLYAKWRFFRQLAVFTVYIVLLTASLYLRPSKDSNQLMVNKTIVGACTGIASNISRNCSSLVMNQIGDPCYLRDCWDDANCIWRYCSEIGALIVALIFLGVFGYHMKTQGWKKVFSTLLQSPTEMLVLLSCFLIILAIPGRAACHSDYEDILLTLAVVLAWPYYMFFHRGFKLVGPFVVMIFKMCKADLVRFILIYAIFMMGFSQALYVLFVGTSTELFNHPAGAMLGLFHMTLGEFQDHYDEMSQSSYQFLAKALFVVMMVLMFTLLVNMLIAMMGNTYQTVADTRKEWTRQWAQIVLIMEKTVGWRDLCKYQKQYMYEGGSGGWTGYFAYTSYDNNVEDDQQVVKPSSIDLYEALNIPSKNVFSA